MKKTKHQAGDGRRETSRRGFTSKPNSKQAHLVPAAAFAAACSFAAVRSALSGSLRLECRIRMRRATAGEFEIRLGVTFGPQRRMMRATAGESKSRLGKLQLVANKIINTRNSVHSIGLENNKQKGSTSCKQTSLASAADARRRSRCAAVFAAVDAARSVSGFCILA